MKPSLHLDIDGVLLANEENLTIGAIEFIKYAGRIAVGFLFAILGILLLAFARL